MKQRVRSNKGFTIIETLVASVLLIFTIGALTAAMRSSRALQMNDLLRRQARAHVQTVLEEHVIYTEYDSIQSVGGFTKQLFFHTDSVSTTVSLNVITDTKTVGTHSIPFKNCVASALWSDPWSGTGDTLTITRIVPEL